MSAPIIAFCNPRRGVGTTTLVYHLAYMFSDLGVPTLMADLDPQVDLSVRFLGQSYNFPVSIYQRLSGRDSRVARHGSGPSLSVGNPWLVQFDYRPLPPGADLRRVIQEDAASCGAVIVLADLGPNLGALNRTTLLASNHVIAPTAADSLSRTGRLNLIDAMREWNIPADVLGCVSKGPQPENLDDLQYLGGIRQYPGLAEMATEAGKPMFHLAEADGALGSHFAAMQSARKDFEDVARRIAERIGLKIPQLPGA